MFRADWALLRWTSADQLMHWALHVIYISNTNNLLNKNMVQKYQQFGKTKMLKTSPLISIKCIYTLLLCNFCTYFIFRTKFRLCFKLSYTMACYLLLNVCVSMFRCFPTTRLTLFHSNKTTWFTKQYSHETLLLL